MQQFGETATWRGGNVMALSKEAALFHSRIASERTAAEHARQGNWRGGGDTDSTRVQTRALPAQENESESSAFYNADTIETIVKAKGFPIAFAV